MMIVFSFYVQQHLQLHVQQLEMHSDKNNSNPDLYLFTQRRVYAHIFSCSIWIWLRIFSIALQEELKVLDYT